ncbi:MAG: hypothetical protein ACRDA3_15315 [Peptostreptococcaceae bacterium]
MNRAHIETQIINIKKAMDLTKNHMKVAKNNYQLECLKIQHAYLKDYLKNLENIYKSNQLAQEIIPKKVFRIEEIE